jgi:hypothetical protein
MIKLTNRKLIISGSTIEAYFYNENPVSYDFEIPEASKQKERIIVVDDESKQKKIESRRRSMQRAGSNLRRLINTNVWRWYKENGRPYLPTFVTFTFKEDVRDIKYANDIFSDFIRRLNYWVFDTKKSFLKYTVVTEFQDKNRHVIHYHVVFYNLKFTWNDTLGEIWEQGGTHIQKINHVDNVGAYVSKYMSKNFEDERLDGHKRYFSSRGLLQPIVVRDQRLAEKIIHTIPEKYIACKKDFVSVYHGSVTYIQFKVNDGKDLSDILSYLP